MAFDWFTLLAQLANFAVLVALLRVFLYRPVLDAMAQREELAAAPLREARRLAAEAEAEREALREARATFERERLELMADVAREAEERRSRSLASVESEAAELRAEAQRAVAREIGRVTDRLRTRLSDLVVDEVGRTLQAVAGTSLDAAAWASFEEKLRALPAGRRDELAAAARDGVKVVSPRPLPPEVSAAASGAVRELLGASDVTFATDPELVVGVALEAGGMRVDGSAAARLERLRDAFAAALADAGVGEDS